MNNSAYQIENRDLHHALVEIRRLVFDDLDGNNLLRLEVLALDDLAEGALAKDIEDQISVSKKARSLATSI